MSGEKRTLAYPRSREESQDRDREAAAVQAKGCRPLRTTLGASLGRDVDRSAGRNFEEYGDPAHPVVKAADARIEALAEKRAQLGGQPKHAVRARLGRAGAHPGAPQQAVTRRFPGSFEPRRAYSRGHEGRARVRCVRRGAAGHGRVHTAALRSHVIPPRRNQPQGSAFSSMLEVTTRSTSSGFALPSRALTTS
jgi:hypothetical protein